MADVEDVDGAVRLERQVSDGEINAVTETGARIVQIYQVEDPATAESVLNELRALAEDDGWDIEEFPDTSIVTGWRSADRVENERTRTETRYELSATVASNGTEVSLWLQHLR